MWVYPYEWNIIQRLKGMKYSYIATIWIHPEKNASWKKSVTVGHMLHDFTYVKYPE